MSENESSLEYIQPIADNHLQELISHFDKEFPAHGDPRKFHLWVVNPFLNVNEPNSLAPAEKNQLLGNSHTDFFRCIFDELIVLKFLDIILLELTSDPTLENRFGSTDLNTFWLGLKDE